MTKKFTAIQSYFTGLECSKGGFKALEFLDEFLPKKDHRAVGRELKDGVSVPASITRDASLVYCKLWIWQCLASRPTKNFYVCSPRRCLSVQAMSKTLHCYVALTLLCYSWKTHAVIESGCWESYNIYLKFEKAMIFSSKRTERINGLFCNIYHDT